MPQRWAWGFKSPLRHHLTCRNGEREDRRGNSLGAGVCPEGTGSDEPDLRRHVPHLSSHVIGWLQRRKRVLRGLRLELDDVLVNGSGTPPNAPGDPGRGLGRRYRRVRRDGAGLHAPQGPHRTAQRERRPAARRVESRRHRRARPLARRRRLVSVRRAADGRRRGRHRMECSGDLESRDAERNRSDRGPGARPSRSSLTRPGRSLPGTPYTGFKSNLVDARAELRAAVCFTAPFALRIVELDA